MTNNGGRHGSAEHADQHRCPAAARSSPCATTSTGVPRSTARRARLQFEQAIKALEEVFDETMPAEMGFDYMGMSYQEKKAAQGVSPAAIFGLSFLFVFLIWRRSTRAGRCPSACCWACRSRYSARLLPCDAAAGQQCLRADWPGHADRPIREKRHPDRRVRQDGIRKRQAADGSGAKAARKLRLRPILMTAFAFILGCVPLWTASGAGAISRRVLGTAVIGGMLAASLLAIFFIPVSFDVIERMGNYSPRATRGRRASACGFSYRNFGMIRTRTTVAAVLAALAGCKVGPNYQRPALDVPGQYRGTAPALPQQAAATPLPR